MNPEKTQKKSIAPIKRGHGLNIYNADQINAAGGIEAFNKLIGNVKPIEAPNIESAPISHFGSKNIRFQPTEGGKIG